MAAQIVNEVEDDVVIGKYHIAENGKEEDGSFVWEIYSIRMMLDNADGPVLWSTSRYDSMLKVMAKLDEQEGIRRMDKPGETLANPNH